MPFVKEIPRNARLAWSQLPHRKALLALGGRGMSAALELVEIDLADSTRRGYDVPLSVNLNGNSVAELQWTRTIEGVANEGILIAALDDASLHCWNAGALLSEVDRCRQGRRTYSLSEFPSSSVLGSAGLPSVPTSMANNAGAPNYTALGFSNGDLSIADLTLIGTEHSIRLHSPGADPAAAHRHTAVTALRWNPTVAHVLAASCANGETHIWNMKQRKASVTVRDSGHQRPSCISWLTETRVVVGYDDDSRPSLQMWDLRRTAEPLWKFPGHTRGIVSMHVCPHDRRLLMTSGRDCRIACWALDNVDEPALFAEIPVTEWQEAIQFSPLLPAVFATASHLEGVFVDSLNERCHTNVKHVPVWLEKPAGLSAGYGGRLVTWGPTEKSTVEIQPTNAPTSETYAEILAQADKFEQLILSNDLVQYCEQRRNEVDPADEQLRLVWSVIGSMFAPPVDRVNAVLGILGLDTADIVSAAEDFIGGPVGTVLASASTVTNMVDATSRGDVTVKDGTSRKIGTSAAVAALLPETLDAEDFFNSLGSAGKSTEPGGDWVTSDAVNTAAETRDSDSGGSPRQQTLIGRPESRDYDSGHGLLLKKALLVGQMPAAVEIAVKSGRWDLALWLATTCGDASLGKQVQDLFLLNSVGDRFVQMFGCVNSHQWSRLVQIADLARWEEAVGLLCVYAPQSTSLVLELGQRLENERFDIKAAAVCYLIAGDFPRVAKVWCTLEEAVNGASAESADEGRPLKRLQNLVLSLAVLRQATGFTGSTPEMSNKVAQYVSLLVDAGRTAAALKFISLVVSPHEPDAILDVLRERIFNAASPEEMADVNVSPPSRPAFAPIKLNQSPTVSLLCDTRSTNTSMQNSHNSMALQSRLSSHGHMGQGPPMPSQTSHLGAQGPPMAPPIPSKHQVPHLGQGPPLPPAHLGGQGPPMPQAPHMGQGQPMPQASHLGQGPPMPGATHMGQGPPMPQASHINQGPPMPQASHLGQGPMPPMGQTSQVGNPSLPSAPPLQGPPSLHHNQLPSSGPPRMPQVPPPPQTGAHAPQNMAQPPPPPSSASTNSFGASRPSMPPQGQPTLGTMSGRVSGPSLPPRGAEPPTTSTAPTAGVNHVRPGMPVPWPIPTHVQQAGSNTTTTATANTMILNKLHGGSPMPAKELAELKSLWRKAVDGIASTVAPNVVEETRQKGDEMLRSAEEGVLDSNEQMALLNCLKAIDAGDLTTAGRLRTQLVSTCWDKGGKNWLMALKRTTLRS